MPGECDLADVVNAAVADAGATYPNTRFDIAAQVAFGRDVEAVRVQQLLTNLLVNAAQHGGTASPVRIEAGGSADAVVLRVINHGRPVPQEDIERIFKPLVQLPASDTRATSLGLGLYIAREIAMAHGGTLALTSDADRGTVFEARLPRRAPAA